MTRKKGLERLMVRLPPAMIEALKTEAHRRAVESGSLQPNASELVQEAVERWLSKRATPKKRRS